MLRPEEGYHLYAGGLEEYVDGGVKVAVHAAGIGYEAYFLADQGRKAVVPEDLDAGFNLSSICSKYASQYYAGY